MSLSDAEARKLLVAAIKRLPERLQLALALLTNHGLNEHERAVLLRCSPLEADALALQAMRVLRPILSQVRP